MDLLISSQELDKQSANKIIQSFIDATPFSEYMNGHIPDELYIDFLLLYLFDTYKRGIKDFNWQSRLLLSNPGIRESNIVCYDDVSGSLAVGGFVTC